MKHRLYLLLLIVPTVAVVLLVMMRRTGNREWPSYPDTSPEIALLEPTGSDLPWTSAEELGGARQFMSNNPEALGLPSDYSSTNALEASRWPLPNMEGKLWTDEATGKDEIQYNCFLFHQNCFTRPLYVGLIVENLSPNQALTVSGESVVSTGLVSGADRASWEAQKSVGKRNAYADLTDTRFTPLPTYEIPPASTDTRERQIISWQLYPSIVLGAHVRLRIRRHGTGASGIRCRLSTAWAWQAQRLTERLPLIPLQGTTPRGSWPTSDVRIANEHAAFDLGKDEQSGRTVRWLRICQPVYATSGKKLGYTKDVVYTKARSYHADQAYINNGMYGVRTQARLYVTNSGPRTETLGLYLRYADEKIRGSYVGAATIYAYDAVRGQWQPKATRAVDLGTMTYTDAAGHVVQRDCRWATKRLAAYPIKPGETMAVPLTVMTDGPAMLPLAIVMRKE